MGEESRERGEHGSRSEEGGEGISCGTGIIVFCVVCAIAVYEEVNSKAQPYPYIEPKWCPDHNETGGKGSPRTNSIRHKFAK